MIVLIITVLALVIIIPGAIIKKKEQEKEAARKADLDQRMAVLQDIKADKDRRRVAREEKEKVEKVMMRAIREETEKEKAERISRAERRRREKEAEIERKRQEQLRWEEERRKEEEALNKAMAKLGISDFQRNEDDEENNDFEYYDDAIELSSNEYLDIDKFLRFAHKNEWDEGLIIMHIQASSGSSLVFFLDGPEKKYKATVGDGTVKKFPTLKALRNYVWCFCQNEQILEINKRIGLILTSGINEAKRLSSIKTDSEEYLADILQKSDYNGLFNKHAKVLCNSFIAIIEYELPSKDDLTWIKDYKYIAASNSIKETPMAESTISKTYEQLLYSICLRSIYEICVAKKAEEFNTVVFNGFVSAINRTNGIKERKCILSLQVSKEQFLLLELKNVDPKKCFKSLKGVSAAKLIDISPVQPVLSFNKKDNRFVEGRDVQIDFGMNLASMDWEDFEHLVRELFEMEFSRNGGEVRVTQASRDGGVDAIVFDPDPLRGGKIVIQAKRYTNTVGVSAVRDLYGTVINEGANSGILITTSDYGHDSYEFAKDKPLKLLNGGHLLALLHKNGKEGYINIQEAKEAIKEV